MFDWMVFLICLSLVVFMVVNLILNWFKICLVRWKVLLYILLGKMIWSLDLKVKSIVEIVVIFDVKVKVNFFCFNCVNFFFKSLWLGLLFCV